MAVVDMIPFKLDIDELINDFVDGGSTTLTGMKMVWKDRKFSFIYESSPKSDLAFFMQSLYTHCTSCMVPTEPLSRRLGGLYCLYCLYETQPFKPPFKIYLSVRDLQTLRSLAVDAKRSGVQVGAALIKKMLESSLFLFGFVELDDRNVVARVDEITKLQTTGVQLAYKKLLANTRIEEYIHMDLGGELNLEELKKISAEYAKAKEVAIKEAGEVVEVEDIKHITDTPRLFGDAVEEISEEWNAQKERFYKKTGTQPADEAVAEELKRLLGAP